MKANVSRLLGLSGSTVREIYVRVHNDSGHVIKFLQTMPLGWRFKIIGSVNRNVRFVLGTGDYQDETVPLVKARSTQ